MVSDSSSLSADKERSVSLLISNGNSHSRGGQESNKSLINPIISDGVISYFLQLLYMSSIKWWRSFFVIVSLFPLLIVNPWSGDLMRSWPFFLCPSQLFPFLSLLEDFVRVQNDPILQIHRWYPIPLEFERF